MKFKINKMKHKNNFLIFIFSTILVILISIFYHPNYIFAMNKNKNIDSSSSSGYKKTLDLNPNSKKIAILSHLENKAGQSNSFYDILKNTKVLLNRQLKINSLEELKSKFSNIEINSFISFDFLNIAPNYDNNQIINKIFSQEYYPISTNISLNELEEIIDIDNENNTFVKLKKENISLHRFLYDNKKNSYIGCNENTRWNADNILEYFLNIEIIQTKQNDININLLFKTYSFTSDNFWFTAGLNLENIVFKN
ncbi:hypothetical protein ['Cynodon dactylon' phytoplasma]|uniref:hypothetical protein n=1 Tax='Cynodon dactylon' phytoplasma TaxID=295320 RepID=UPI001265CECF|nr:hypothetical protein ['Cynodon dactylon' phytoplasma]KAB8121802.1 hypothetical protein F1741_01580 ['Cynodon dactylon' phytoplasma]